MFFRDPNTLFVVPINVGNVKKITSCKNHLTLFGEINQEFFSELSFNQVILLDSAYRFLSGCEIEKEKWFLDIYPDAFGNDLNYLEPMIFAASSANSFIYPQKIEGKNLKRYSNYVNKLLPKNASRLPSYKDDYIKIIEKAMNERYVSLSNINAIPTGNNYQTIDLGSLIYQGGRSNREKLLSKINFSDRTVMDLGANTGEISRLVRKKGASIVDGYEYDPFFVETGRVINAIMGMTRVSLFQGDISKPDFYIGKKYDIIIALAVWVYIKEVMDHISKISDIMVFETHTLDHGIDFYYKSMIEYFPYAISLGLTDKPIDPYKGRMLIIFGKNKENIEKLLNREILIIKPYFDNAFINKYNHLSKSEIINLAKLFQDKYKDRKKHLFEVSDYKYGTETYFEIFLAGYFQYLENNKLVDLNNLFLNFFKIAVLKGELDQKLLEIVKNDNWLIRKISNKYIDMSHIIDGKSDLVAPIELSVEENGELHFNTTTGEKLIAKNIDGHHRFFMCELSGIEKFHTIIRRPNNINDGILEPITYKKLQYSLKNY